MSKHILQKSFIYVILWAVIPSFMSHYPFYDYDECQHPVPNPAVFWTLFFLLFAGVTLYVYGFLLSDFKTGIRIFFTLILILILPAVFIFLSFKLIDQFEDLFHKMGIWDYFFKNGCFFGDTEQRLWLPFVLTSILNFFTSYFIVRNGRTLNWKH